MDTPAEKIIQPELKNKEKDSVLPVPMSACAITKRLLANPPFLRYYRSAFNSSTPILKQRTFYKEHMGFSESSGSLESNSYDKNSNDVIRANVACQLGLVVNPLNEELSFCSRDDYPAFFREAELRKNAATEMKKYEKHWSWHDNPEHSKNKVIYNELEDTELKRRAAWEEKQHKHYDEREENELLEEERESRKGWW